MNEAAAFGVVPLTEMNHADDAERSSIADLAIEARDYLEHFAWYPKNGVQYYALSVPGVVGVFLFDLRESNVGERFLWVVVGDLPSAYLVVDDAPDGVSALERYCEIMEGWVLAVLNGSPLSGQFSVSVEPTKFPRSGSPHRQVDTTEVRDSRDWVSGRVHRWSGSYVAR